MEANPSTRTAPTVFPQQTGASSYNSPNCRARILLVDDDEILREILSEALILEGFEVVCAEDGEAGWQHLCKEEFDLLVTDHNMPRLSGFDLVNRIKYSHFQIRTIMITGYVPYQYPASAKSLPFCDIVAKPFSLKTFIQKVENSLHLKEA